jgi:PhzF family phenazine biosynthesis protein
MKLPLYWVDAFADRVFRGNPAVVVPLTEWLDDATMQKIAFEHGVSETAFFVKQGEAQYQLRWFTPAVEVDLCGHATLASAHVLFSELHLPGNKVTFNTRSGPLTVVHHKDWKLELDFPAQPAASLSYDVTAVTSTRESTVVRGLGLAPEYLAKTERMWLGVYPHVSDVTSLKPDFKLLSELNPARVVVTAAGTDCDFVSRFFSINGKEDPVTGSSHCTLVPYWAARLGKKSLHARQVSARGGELWCTLDGDRVKIAGRAVLYLRGEISFADKKI